MAHQRSIRLKGRVGSVVALATLASTGSMQNAAALPVYAFATERVTLSVSGATVVPLFTSSRDTLGFAVGAGNGFDENTDPLDPPELAAGPAAPPPQNDFFPSTPNIGSTRSDALIVPFSGNSVTAKGVAETNLTFIGAAADSAENKVDFRVVQTGAAPITFTLDAIPGLDVSSTAAGDSTMARIEGALEVFDPTGAKKALWLPCGSTGVAASNNCNQPGNGLTVDPGFAGNLAVTSDPFTLNMLQSCAGAGCSDSYSPGADTFGLTANVGAGSNIFVELDTFVADLASGDQMVPPLLISIFDDEPIDEPSGLVLFGFALSGLSMAMIRRRRSGGMPRRGVVRRLQSSYDDGCDGMPGLPRCRMRQARRARRKPASARNPLPSSAAVIGSGTGAGLPPLSGATVAKLCCPVSDSTVWPMP